MPYIITTATPLRGEPVHEPLDRITRTAVATLEEAREACYDVLIKLDNDPAPYFDAHFAVDNMDDSGGSVGPLPDGTVIEVRPTTWERVARDAGLETWRLVTDPAPVVGEQILAAFNAAQ